MNEAKEKDRTKAGTIRRLLRSKWFWGAWALLCLGTLIVWQLSPVSQEEKQRNKLIVEVRSWYELREDSLVVLTFSNIDGDSLLSGATTDTLHPMAHLQQSDGYWVNRYRRFPSCQGRIAVATAPKPSNLIYAKSSDLHDVVRRQAMLLEDKLAGLETQQNELHYYRRTHNVQDFGYNSIAKYSVSVDSCADSLRTIVKRLFAIKPQSHLSLHHITRYKLIQSADGKRKFNQECHLLHDYEDGFAVIQLPHRRTPKGIVTHMSIADGKEALRQKVRKAAKKPGEHDDKTVQDSLGTYVGQVDSLRRPDGYGKRFGLDGSYHEGHFKAGLPEGFGFRIAPRQYLQAGEWRQGVFKGEKLTYNAERIYGIDVSRHQHEQDGRYYPIQWKKLRITNLGTLSTKRVSGKVDYPVSFAYIKSTEGCTVLNGYYETDYREARAAGIVTGTYHFFSLTSGGREQARHFMQKSQYQKGDLPPVLDVEPTDWQIEQAGGTEAMFRQVRAWLKAVQEQWKVRPILYIGQSFALKYMPFAPDLSANYFVWIARYGEYMPHFKLTFWQLSPDGGVSGIRGDVDINIYNGYKVKYQQFLDKHCKK